MQKNSKHPINGYFTKLVILTNTNLLTKYIEKQIKILTKNLKVDDFSAAFFYPYGIFEIIPSPKWIPPHCCNLVVSEVSLCPDEVFIDDIDDQPLLQFDRISTLIVMQYSCIVEEERKRECLYDVFQNIPDDTQCILVSNTVTWYGQQTANRFMRDGWDIFDDDNIIGINNINHYYYEYDEHNSGTLSDVVLKIIKWFKPNNIMCVGDIC
eukprot:467907_1